MPRGRPKGSTGAGQDKPKNAGRLMGFCVCCVKRVPQAGVLVELRQGGAVVSGGLCADCRPELRGSELVEYASECARQNAGEIEKVLFGGKG